MKLGEISGQCVAALDSVAVAINNGTVAIGPSGKNAPDTEWAGVLLLHTRKGGALVGFERGHAMAFKVLRQGSSDPPTPPVLSPPVMLTLSKLGFGIQLGYSEANTLMLFESERQLEMLVEEQEIAMGKDLTLQGKELPDPVVVVGLGQQPQATSATNRHSRLVMVSTTAQNMLLDISFHGAKLEVDSRHMHEAYGKGVTPQDVLDGRAAEVPEHLQQLCVEVAKKLQELEGFK